jgi:hypothetical protein
LGAESALTGAAMHTLVVHPPIIIENLLSEGGIFALMHAEQGDSLWRAALESGEAKAIYSVGLMNPLTLMINLGFCSTLKGALVHSRECERPKPTP